MKTIVPKSKLLMEIITTNKIDFNFAIKQTQPLVNETKLQVDGSNLETKFYSPILLKEANCIFHS